ncbi:MAG: YHS domain-containing protein, partial [Thermodesulfobacteriota bacterium]|nr:YHS domain-containing protein [Thermodesulfobacteriota bacterium]
GYIFYRGVRGLFGFPGKIDQRRSNGVIDEMVQDPQCKTYIPRRDARRKIVGGKERFFCSKECADRFENEMN